MSTAVLRDATHWDEVVARLGHEHLRRHDLRHTGLTWLADAGVPLHILRRIAGHGPLTTTSATSTRTPTRSQPPAPRSPHTSACCAPHGPCQRRPSSPADTGQGSMVPNWSPRMIKGR
ncbi:tyrosine-type recombinase/integrase [Streptomyces sp. ACT015]|uniref:tyrosine-type recombinase/integrase n=1 Tax=Streptomyces sp. ACT015 TaxID=3134807 RepID=UPI003D165513